MKRIILLILFTLSFMIVNAQDMVQRNGRWVCPKHTNTTMELGTRCHVCRHEEAQANAKKEKENRARAEAERERKREEEAKNHKVVEVTSPERTLKIVWPDNEYKNENKKETESKADKDEEAEDKEEKSESKSSKKTYIPKTTSQMYAEMKTMAERSPGMMNDPNFRQRLRHMEVDANREQQTIRDYRSGVQYANSAAISQYNASNRKIDTYTKAVGDVTDAATSLVNSIIAVGEEKKRREQAERDAAHQRKLQSIENNRNYIDAVIKERNDFTSKTTDKIKNEFNSYRSISVGPLSFKAKKMLHGQEHEEQTINLYGHKAYLVANDAGKLGLIDDDGSMIYPPQFNVAFIVRDDTDNEFNRNLIAVMADNRWGLLYPNGSVAVNMEYDYIYFLPNYNLIVKDGNDYIFIPNESIKINGHLIDKELRVSTSDIRKYFPEGIIPSAAGINEHLYSENINSAFHKESLIYNSFYSKDNIRSLIDLNGNTVWPKTPKAQHKVNTNIYTALPALPEQNYYRINDKWYTVTQSNNAIEIVPAEQQEFTVFRLGKGTSVIDRKEKVLTTVKWTLSAPFSEDGLAPIADQGYTNKQGEIVIPSYSFSKSSKNPNLGEFKNGFAVVGTGDGYSTFNAINTKGEKLLAKDVKSKAAVYYTIAWNYSNGADNFQQDKAKAYDYYLTAAEEGSASAMNNIGVMYMIGDYVQKDTDEALIWYEQAAKKGDNMAAKNLAYHYKGTNITESVKWFEQAAKSYPETHYELAKIYSTNEEVKNASKAVEWFEKVARRYQNSAEQKAEANYYIGTVYECQSDANLRKSAKDYFSKAAQAGHQLATAKLNKKVKKNEIATFELDKNNTAYLVSLISYDFKKTTYHGPYKLFDNNGQLREVRRYVNGKLIGEAKIYDKTGVEVIVPLKYDNVEHFSDGLAMVQLNNKWGFIDKTGKEVTPLKYDNTWDFSNGLAKVKINNKWGLIDKTGKEVTPLKYDATWAFPDDIVGVKLNDKWGFIDKMGKEMIPLKYDATLGFSDGIAGVKLNDKWGVIDKTGKEVTPLKYDDMEIFVDGLAMVKLNDKYGFIDKTGKEVIPLKYDFVGGFSDGLARVKLNDKWSFIDKTGKEVIPLKHDGAWGFSDGLAEVILNNKYGFIDKTGKEVTPLKYDDSFAFSDGLAKVKLNDKWGFIDKTGKEVTPLKYDATWAFSDGLAAVKLNDKWGFIDKMGKEVTPLKYDTTWGFSDGLAVVKLNDKWGFIDSTGKEVIPLIYDATWAFSDGLAAVKLNDKWRFIDKTGEEVVPLKYDYDDVRSFSNGLAKVKINNKWGFIDKTGKEVIYR